MKYVIINGSPRKKNTWKVVEQVKKNLDGEFEEVQLIKEKIAICNGCFKCFTDGEEKCPHHDRVSQIMEKIDEADGIIITSPVYALNVSGLLKNFIDHTAYLYHRPKHFTKKALVIVTTAGAAHKKVANYMDETLRHWGVNRVYKINLACGGKDNLDTKKIDDVALEFRNDVESGKLHSPKLMDLIFYEVWRVMAIKEYNALDKKYWTETGLIDNDFAPEVPLGILKKAFAKVMFPILKRVI